VEVVESFVWSLDRSTPPHASDTLKLLMAVQQNFGITTPKPPAHCACVMPFYQSCVLAETLSPERNVQDHSDFRDMMHDLVRGLGVSPSQGVLVSPPGKSIPMVSTPVQSGLVRGCPLPFKVGLLMEIRLRFSCCLFFHKSSPPDAERPSPP